MSTPSQLAFDSPFLDDLGLRLVEWRENHALVELPVQPRHLNRRGVMNGGVISTIADAACGFSGLYAPPGAPALHSFAIMLSVQFVAPGRTSLVRAIGERTGGGRSTYFGSCRIEAEDGSVIAVAHGAFKYMPSPGEKPNV
jgi:uncharacterized protein (TIGR00369 family)